MDIEQILTCGNAVNSISSIRIGQGADGCACGSYCDYGCQMDPLSAGKRDPPGDAAGRL